MLFNFLARVLDFLDFDLGLHVHELCHHAYVLLVLALSFLLDLGVDLWQVLDAWHCVLRQC